MPLSPFHYALGATAIAATGLFAVYIAPFYAGEDRFADCRSSAIAGGTATVGGPFSLTDENGNAVTERDILAGPALVYFGFTHCPDLCPTDMVRTADAVDLLAGKGYAVTPVFISVDPRRDDPAALKEWTDAMHPRMIGLTGTPEQIRAAAQAYRTVYSVPENPADENYAVEHMTQTYLMLPETGFAQFYTRETSAEEMAASVACFLDRAS